jgi:hypothetical protein
MVVHRPFSWMMVAPQPDIETSARPLPGNRSETFPGISPGLATARSVQL